MYKLKVPAAVGACYIGADAAGLTLPKTYADSTSLFFTSNIAEMEIDK